MPGRCRADLDRLRAEIGIPFERGPDELKDLPAYFGKAGRTRDPTRHDTFRTAAHHESRGRSLWSDLAYSERDAALPSAEDLSAQLARRADPSQDHDARR